MVNSEFGEPINGPKASAIINNRIRLMKELKEQMVPMFKNEESDLTKNEKLSFTDNDYNGFVFSKSLLEDFWKYKLPSGELANFLLVALGAEIDPVSKRMLPTVIIAPCGVEKVNGELKVTGVDNLNPAVETPPKIVLVDGFPTAQEKAIRFTIK